jgi:phage baseplate assembly protein gpV
MNCRTPRSLSLIPFGALLALAVLVVLAILIVGAAAGCGKATPTAPTGSTLTLTVNPVAIASTQGSATVTATLHRPNGTPDPGAQVQFSTTLGNITPTLGKTDSNGVAVATLTGDGRFGTAKVTAFSGAVMSSEVDVTIGAQATSITLSAIPANVPTSTNVNGTPVPIQSQVVTLQAALRDAQGNLVVNSPVSFTTQVGTLNPSLAFSNSLGLASSNLTLTFNDLDSQATDSFNISATAGAGGSSGTQTLAINILRPPLAGFTFSVNVHTVTFTDTTLHHPTSWLWKFGDGTTSQAQNPAHTYTVPNMTYTVTLTASNALGSSSTNQAVPIPP